MCFTHAYHPVRKVFFRKKYHFIQEFVNLMKNSGKPAINFNKKRMRKYEICAIIKQLSDFNDKRSDCDPTNYSDYKERRGNMRKRTGNIFGKFRFSAG